MRTHDLRMGFFYFIKPRYDLKNYESVGGTTKQFILFGGKANSIFGFFRLSLSLSASPSYGKFLGKEIAHPRFINKEHAKFKSLMCLCMKTHQKVEGLGGKVIHRLGIAGCCSYVVLCIQRVHWIIFSSFNFACYGPRKTSTTVDNLSRAFCFV